MMVDEIWAVATERIRRFLQSQPDVAPDGEGFRCGGCRIRLSPVEPGELLGWRMPRTRVQMEGSDEDVAGVYRRFFLQFLTAGG